MTREESENYFAKHFNHEREIIKDMTKEQLIERRAELENILLEARARLNALEPKGE